ncbi:MAG: fatty acid desaturase [Bacteriovoracaceae bacterium]|nr:fatty acid desaturase [Bacteriovoracaceae bacterium]
MNLFKYKEDRLPIFIISTFFVIDLIYYFNVDNLFYLTLWCLLGIVIKGITAAWNHNHQHCNTFKYPFLNRLIEIVYGMHTGVCGYTWVLHHNIGHHSNYLDQSKDESHWKNSKGERMIRLRYSFEIFITSYYRCFIVGLKHPRILKKFLGMVSITLAIMVTLTYYRPIPALIILWIPAVLSLLITADSTYWHHSGLDTSDPMAASRNSLSSICFNKLTGNFGYHTAHHYKGGLHWTKLPALHEKIKHKIPKECYLPPTPFFATLDYLIRGYRSLLSLPEANLAHELD